MVPLKTALRACHFLRRHPHFSPRSSAPPNIDDNMAGKTAPFLLAIARYDKTGSSPLRLGIIESSKPITGLRRINSDDFLLLFFCVVDSIRHAWQQGRRCLDFENFIRATLLVSSSSSSCHDTRGVWLSKHVMLITYTPDREKRTKENLALCYVERGRNRFFLILRYIEDFMVPVMSFLFCIINLYTNHR